MENKVFKLNDIVNISPALLTVETLFDITWGKDVFPKGTMLPALYPFQVRVLVIKDIPPRHPMFQPFLEVGLNDLEKIINLQPIDGKESLIFYFPERHLTVLEEYYFMKKLSDWVITNNPMVKKVSIATRSPILVSDFVKEQILVMSSNLDK